jgi:hypothetical protein
VINSAHFIHLLCVAEDSSAVELQLVGNFDVTLFISLVKVLW